MAIWTGGVRLDEIGDQFVEVMFVSGIAILYVLAKLFGGGEMIGLSKPLNFLNHFRAQFGRFEHFGIGAVTQQRLDDEKVAASLRLDDDIAIR